MLKSELNMFTGNRTMVKFLHLKIFIVFSSFPFILGDTKQNRSTAVGIDHGVTDGHNFLKKIVHGVKMSERPGYLVFTAPYKLCDGGCKAESSDFVMAFPLFIGKKGREVYKTMFPRDFENVHSKRPNAPFRQKTTRVAFTTCPPVTTTVSKCSESTSSQAATTESTNAAPITTESSTIESTAAKSTSTASSTTAPSSRKPTRRQPTTTKSTTTEPATTTPTNAGFITELLLNVTTHSTTPFTTSTNIPTLLPSTHTKGTTCPDVVPRICRKRTKMSPRSLTQTTTFCPNMFPLLCRAQTATGPPSSEIKKVDDYFSSYRNNLFKL